MAAATISILGHGIARSQRVNYSWNNQCPNGTIQTSQRCVRWCSKPMTKCLISKAPTYLENGIFRLSRRPYKTQRQFSVTASQFLCHRRFPEEDCSDIRNSPDSSHAFAPGCEKFSPRSRSRSVQWAYTGPRLAPHPCSELMLKT